MSWPPSRADTDRVIPKGKPRAIIRVPIDQLRSLLDVAEEIGTGVTFEIHDGNGPMVLRGKHDESDQEFLGLIMPLIDASATQPRTKVSKGVAEVTPVEPAPEPEEEPAPAEESRSGGGPARPSLPRPAFWRESVA